MIEKPLYKQELNLNDEIETQEQLSLNPKCNLIKNICIVLISIVFQILEIIIQIIVFFKYKEYEEKSDAFLKGIGAIVIGFLAVINIIASIFVGIILFFFSKYKCHFSAFCIILIIKMIFPFLFTKFYSEMETIMFIIYYIFEAFYLIICIIYIIIYAYLQSNNS